MKAQTETSVTISTLLHHLDNSSPSTTLNSSNWSIVNGKKTGRPNGWTDSRKRKLARLYLYTNLPPKDICQALKDNESGWKPGSVEVLPDMFIIEILTNEPCPGSSQLPKA